MSAFGVFKGLYREAQNLNDIANQNGIKTGVKDQIRESADRIRALADNMEGDIITLESCECCDPLKQQE